MRGVDLGGKSGQHAARGEQGGLGSCTPSPHLPPVDVPIFSKVHADPAAGRRGRAVGQRRLGTQAGCDAWSADGSRVHHLQRHLHHCLRHDPTRGLRAHGCRCVGHCEARL